MLDLWSAKIHIYPNRVKRMPKKTTATIARSAVSGRFTVKKDGGQATVHTSGKKTPKTVSQSISKNRDALQRLANR